MRLDSHKSTLNSNANQVLSVPTPKIRTSPGPVRNDFDQSDQSRFNLRKKTSSDQSSKFEFHNETQSPTNLKFHSEYHKQLATETQNEFNSPSNLIVRGKYRKEVISPNDYEDDANSEAVVSKINMGWTGVPSKFSRERVNQWVEHNKMCDKRSRSHPESPPIVTVTRNSTPSVDKLDCTGTIRRFQIESCTKPEIPRSETVDMQPRKGTAYNVSRSFNRQNSDI
jgi:hypothetical protein